MVDISNFMKHSSFTYTTLLALLVGISTLAVGQSGITAAEFEIGGVTVEGAEYSDDRAIIALSGLKVGDRVQVPGAKLSKAINNLYERRLFTDVQILQDKLVGDVIFLVIVVEERPRLSRYTFRGEKKGKHDDLIEIVSTHMVKGGIITEDVKENTILDMENYYIEKGHLDANVVIEEEIDDPKRNSVKLAFIIDKGSKVKIQDITFTGNNNVKDKKLRKLMKNTKRKKAFLKGSKLIESDYQEDKDNIIAYYNEIGFRDARILGDSIWREEDGDMILNLKINEGNQYYVRNISWKGNTLFSDDRLSAVLGIVKGDIYNDALLEERLRFSIDGRDVSSLYLDDGYLFFNVDAVEIAVVKDSIDLEMRVFEGPQATIDKVLVEGNDRTHDHVILRELRTRPGEKFSRSDIIRSQRELLNLGYFDPATLDVQTPVNAQKGTVDIIYKVQERPSDQLELSAGWGGAGAGVFGTLGVVFNNFSIGNLFNGSAWKPLPQGDGQKLSLRFQSNGRFWRSLNFSFTEPWLGGKKPNSFTVGGSDLVSNQGGRLQISRLFVGLGSRLRKPDDNFVTNTTLNFERIGLMDRAQFATDNGISVRNGTFWNFSINQTIARSTVNEPIFPRRGSKISLSVQLTPPYSLFKKDEFYVIDDTERPFVIAEENDRIAEKFGSPPMTPDQEDVFITEATEARKFNFLEYHKWNINAEWYATLVGNLVFMSKAQLGFVGSYSGDIGLSPFERFELGGDGIANAQNGIVGRDVISSRGYEPGDFDANFTTNPNTGGLLDNGAPIYNKYTMELRYPLSTNPNSTIYLHTFVQGANAYKTFGEYNPFELRKSAGFGLRVFLPMFGILGFDYGIGFDKPDVVADPASGLGNFARFNIVLGFEPE